MGGWLRPLGLGSVEYSAMVLRTEVAVVVYMCSIEVNGDSFLVDVRIHVFIGLTKQPPSLVPSELNVSQSNLEWAAVCNGRQ